MTDLQSHVPQAIENRLGNRFAPGGLLVRKQEQEIDVGSGRQQAAAIAAGGDDGHTLGFGGVLRRVKMLSRNLEQQADDLILHEAQPFGAAAPTAIVDEQTLGRGAAFEQGCLEAAREGQSEFAIVAGMLSAEDHRKKADGFAQAVPKYSSGTEIVAVIEGHEDESESFEKTYDLLARFPDLAGLYVNTVNCLPVCQALERRGLAGKVKLVATDLFPEMATHLEKGTITASIYQHPFRQSQIAVRLLADNLANKMDLPPSVYLSPGVIMASNFHLFREMRQSEGELHI